MTQEKAIQLVIEGSDKSLKEIGLIDQELAQVNKQLAQLRKEGKQTGDEYANFTKRQAQLRNQSAEVRKELKNQIKDFDVLEKNLPIDSTIALEREYRKLRETWRKMSAEQKSSDAGKAMAKQAESISNQINISNKSIGDYTKNIGRYEEALKGLEKQLGAAQKAYKKMTDSQKASPLGQTLKQEIDLTKGAITDLKAGFLDLSGVGGRVGQLFKGFTAGLAEYGKQALVFYGVMGGISTALQAIKNTFKIIKDFDDAQTELAALSGQTKEELSGLTEQAKELGRETLFTATEVTKLQIELSKLGFNNLEIEQATKSVINFAVALDANAADAATVAASTLRAFGLDAKEMERVVSVLGVAANKTSLSFSDFEGNIATFAPIARAFGFSLEDSIAIFGKLRDAGFDASSAATAMRNIFLNLADPAGKLAKALGAPIKNLDDLVPALNKLRASGIDLAGTLELTDKRSVAAFNQLLRGGDTLIQLRDNLTDVNEEFKTMVDKRLESLSAKIKLLGSAWQSLVLSIEDGQGSISTNIKNFITGLTNVLNIITGINEGVLTFSDIFKTIFTNQNYVKLALEQNDTLKREAVAAATRLATFIKEGTDLEKQAAQNQLDSLKKRAEAGSKNAKDVIAAYDSIINKQEEVVEEENKTTESQVRNLKFLKEELSRLGDVLKTSVDESILTSATKQIILIEKEIENLETKLNRIRFAAENNDIHITPKINPISNADITDAVGQSTLSGLFFKALEEKNDREFDMLEHFEELRQERKNYYREQDLLKDKQFNDLALAEQEKYNQSVESLFNDLGGVLSSIFENQKDSQKDVFKDLLLITLKFAEAQVRIAAETAQATAAITAIGNPLALAKLAIQAVIINGLISLAFGTLRGLVESFEEGGRVGGNDGKGGKIVNGKPYKKPGSSDNVLIHAKRGEIIVNPKQQEALESMTSPGIWGDIGLPGFKASQSPLNNLIRMNGLDRGDVALSQSAIELLAETMAERTADAILNNNRLVERKRLARGPRRKAS